MKSDPISEQDQDQDFETLTAQGIDLHILNLLIILSRRLRFIFCFTLAAATLAVIGVLLVPSKYTASTLVLPPNQSSSVSAALLSQLGGSSGLASVAGAGLGIKNPADMYVSLFRSRTLEDAMIKRFGLMSRYRVKKMTDARREFEERSTVVLGYKDGLLRIGVTDSDPNLAAEITNAYVDEFRKSSANLAITEAAQRRVFFQQQLLEANQNLASAEEALKRTQQSTGILQVESQARSLVESGAVLRGQIVAKEVEIQSMRSYATDDNPQIATAKLELAALHAQLEKLGGTDKDSSSDIIVPKGNIPQAAMEYVRRLRDEKYYETIFELIARQLEMAKLDEAKQGAIVQVADFAVPPDKRSSPHRAMVVVLMTLIALVIAVFWVLASERWNQMQQDSDRRRKLQTLHNLFFKKHRLQA